MREQVAVIGGGWYGCHTALELAKNGYDVTIVEQNHTLFSEISGQFGVRMHTGQHYPRSKATRDSCVRGFQEFTNAYNDLIVPHDYSIYAVGTTDADGLPSKVTAEEFVRVCGETSRPRAYYGTEIEEKGYRELEVLVELAEPSVNVGRKLNDFFHDKLIAAGVTVRCGYKVESVTKGADKGINIAGADGGEQQYDRVVNATSYQALLPSTRVTSRLPFEVRYQPCLALQYEDTSPESDRPFSFIAMDGAFPCMMPVVPYGEELEPGESRKYILTHGKWTIVASYDNVAEAKARLHAVDDAFIEGEVRPRCEQEIKRFFPGFEGRFKYVGHIGAVLAKPKSETEVRSSVTFQDLESEMIYIMPGKVTNIFDAADEAVRLIQGKDVIHNLSAGHAYVEGGTLHAALPEFEQKISDRNTCDLQTFRVGAEGGAASRAGALSPVLTSRLGRSGLSSPRPAPSASAMGKLLLAIVALFIINELRNKPDVSLRVILGLSGLVALSRMTSISGYGFKLFNLPKSSHGSGVPCACMQEDKTSQSARAARLQ